MYGCPPELLDDPQAIEASLREAARLARSTLLQHMAHRFHPQGVTALGLLAESHISIHTWPEMGYAAADVFTCGEHTRPERACGYLASALKAERFDIRRIARGPQVSCEERPDRLPRTASREHTIRAPELA
jgi:S-adenosylmethionine decarboxylase